MRTGLAALPPALRHLTALQRLSLGNNQLTALDEKLFQGLPALQELDLHSNQLTTLPPGLGAVPALRVLDVRAQAPGTQWDAPTRAVLQGLRQRLQ